MQLLGIIAVWIYATSLTQTVQAASDEHLATNVCAILGQEYVDQRRIQPDRMARGVLAALKAAEPGIGMTWEAEGLVLQVDDQRLVIPQHEPKTLQQVSRLIDDLCHCPVAVRAGRCHELEYALLNGALACLDPYTMVLQPAQAQALTEGLAGEFGGLGANVRDEQGQLLIDGIRPGLPADRAGLKDGDRLVAVAGRPVDTLPIDEVIALLRGKVGAPVVLTIDRAGSSRPLEITAVRAEIPAVTMRSIRIGGIGYVRLDEFSANTAAELRSAIDSLQAAGPLTAFVLDLRRNCGGIVDQACEISADFLPKGSDIVRVVNGNGPAVTYATSRRPLLDVPMVVLVSGQTASSAELLAGTLQCHGRAVLVGTPTLGKGLIQALRDLPDGSLCKVSIREYQLPGNIVVQGVGILSDIVLAVPAAESMRRLVFASTTGNGGHQFLEKPLAVVCAPLAITDLSDENDTDLLAPQFMPDALSQHLIRQVQAAIKQTQEPEPLREAVLCQRLASALESAGPAVR